MPEDLESILRRVAAGELSVEEAEPLVAALGDAASPPPSGHPGPGPDGPPPTDPPRGSDAAPPPTGPHPAQRTVRIVVMEEGKPVVNLRIPATWASLAGSVVPGISTTQSERIREAIRSGDVGPILEVRDEDGGGVIISTE